MNLQEILGAAYLLWPMTILLFIVCLIIGIVLFLSASGVIVFFGLAFYYMYIYLKKKGFFDFLQSWIQLNTTFVTENLRNNISDTFQLQGTENIPTGPCLYLAHPHGLFSMAPFVHCGVKLGQWPTEKSVKIAIHSIFFRIPGVRELMESNSCIEANEDEIRDTLESGTSVIVLTGGVQEISETEPGILRLVLKKRQGVLRIARDLGVPIIPVLTFGENDLFPPVQNWYIEKIQTYLRAWFHISIPIPTWDSIVNWFSLLQGPLKPAVTTCIGQQVLSKKESIEDYRKKVLTEFENLYRSHRPPHYAENLIFV